MSLVCFHDSLRVKGGRSKPDNMHSGCHLRVTTYLIVPCTQQPLPVLANFSKEDNPIFYASPASLTFFLLMPPQHSNIIFSFVTKVKKSLKRQLFSRPSSSVSLLSLDVFPLVLNLSKTFKVKLRQKSTMYPFSKPLYGPTMCTILILIRKSVHFCIQVLSTTQKKIFALKPRPGRGECWS